MGKIKKELDSRILLSLIVIWLFILIINCFFSYTNQITGRVVGSGTGIVNFNVVAKEEIIIPDSGDVQFTTPKVKKIITGITGIERCRGNKLAIVLYGENYPDWSEQEPPKTEVKKKLGRFELTCNCSINDTSNGNIKLFFNLSQSILGNISSNNVRLFVWETNWIELSTTINNVGPESTEFYSVVPHLSKFLIGEKVVSQITPIPNIGDDVGGGGGGVSYLPPVTCVPQCALNEIQCITVSSYLECQNNKSQCLVWVQKSTLSGKQCLQNQLVEVIIKKTVSRCREQWNCTEWSPCLEGQRERVCEDTARCGTAENKPAEQKSCFKLGMAQALMREAIAPLEGCTLNWLWNVLLVLILMGILLLVYKLISTMRWSRLILIFFSLVMVLMEYSFIRWDSCGGKIRVAAGMGILLVLLAFYVLKKKNIPQGKANGREYLSLQQFEKKMMKKELRRR